MKELLEQLKHENQDRTERLNTGMLTETGHYVVQASHDAVRDIIKRMERKLYPN